MRYLLTILALAGLAVSTLALQVHYATGTEPCSINERWDCGIVNHSAYSMIHGVPVAVIGMAGYLALALLSALRRRTLVATLAVPALAFSLYLTHIEHSILNVYCLYCVISLGIIATITLLSLGWVTSARRAA